MGVFLQWVNGVFTKPKTDPTHPFHDCADFVSVQFREEEAQWLGPWADPKVTWEVPIRDLFPMNHPFGRAVRKAFFERGDLGNVDVGGRP